MAKIIDSTNLGYLIGKIKAAFWPKTDVVQTSIDNVPTSGSTNLVSSGGVYDAIADVEQLYFVTYGTTTQSEILAAVADGKLPVCDYDDKVYVYVGESSANYSQFTCVLYETAYRIYVQNSSWGNNSYEIVTDTDMTSALQSKADASSLATVATTGAYSDLSGTPTIPTVPTISTDISADATSDTKTASPKAVKTYVDGICGDIETLLAAI